MSALETTLAPERDEAPAAAAAEPQRASGDPRATRRRVLFVVLGVLTAVVTLASVKAGAMSITPAQVLAILAAKIGIDTGVAFTSAQEAVLLSIRLPRVIFGLMAGACLGICGAAIQGLFRNPLAEPGLIGTSGGAAMTAVWAIILTSAIAGSAAAALTPFVVPVAAFLGSLGVTWLVYRLSISNGRVQVATMLLAGVAINALAFAVMGLAMAVADDAQLRSITFWSLGSMAGASWQSFFAAAPFMLVSIIGLPFLARAMDAVALGESEAYHLGVAVGRLRALTIVFVALSVGASVAITGIIGFIGLVVPHMLRLVAGPGHRALLPASALLGAALLAGADLLSRTIAAPQELPLGVVTALAGAPYFLWLLIRYRERGGLL